MDANLCREVRREQRGSDKLQYYNHWFTTNREDGNRLQAADEPKEVTINTHAWHVDNKKLSKRQANDLGLPKHPDDDDGARTVVIDATKGTTAEWQDPIPKHYVGSTCRREGVARVDTEVRRHNIRAKKVRRKHLPEYKMTPPRGGKPAVAKAKRELKAKQKTLSDAKRVLGKADTTKRNAEKRAKETAKRAKKAGKASRQAKTAEKAAVAAKAARKAQKSAAKQVTAAQKVVKSSEASVKAVEGRPDDEQAFRREWRAYVRMLCNNGPSEIFMISVFFSKYFS